MTEFSDVMMAWSREEFREKLWGKRNSYHLEHPFQAAMHSGKLNREQVQLWALNRYYYQRSIPLKDAAILANCPEREVRCHWIERIKDQDGQVGQVGGLEAWIQLGEAMGLSRQEIVSEERVLPGVRFAVDAYVNFAKTRPWEESVCSSLTELFAPEAHRERLKALADYYPWINSEGLQYFLMRLENLKRDADFSLSVVLRSFTTRKQQEKALQILQFKMDVLWCLLDSIALNCGFFGIRNVSGGSAGVGNEFF